MSRFWLRVARLHVLPAGKVIEGRETIVQDDGGNVANPLVLARILLLPECPGSCSNTQKSSSSDRQTSSDLASRGCDGIAMLIIIIIDQGLFERCFPKLAGDACTHSHTQPLELQAASSTSTAAQGLCPSLC